MSCLLVWFLRFSSALGYRRHGGTIESNNIISKPRYAYKYQNACCVSGQGIFFKDFEGVLDIERALGASTLLPTC